MKKPLLLLVAASCAAAPASAIPSVYPLTENTWSNPEFVKRFTGTYGFDLTINPRITSEEGELFQKVAALAATDPGQAIALLRTALKPDSSAALDFTLGSFLLQQQKTAEAIALYETAIRKFPNFFRAYQNLGLALIQTGRHKEAIVPLTQALEIGAGNGGLFGLLGYAFLNTGRPSEALDAYREALIRQPDSRDWQMGKLNALIALQAHPEVVGMIDGLLQGDMDDTGLWLMQANALLGLSRPLEAAANLEVVHGKQAATAATQALLGDIYLNGGLPDLALEPYLAALRSGSLTAVRALRIGEALGSRAAPEAATTFLTFLDRSDRSGWSPAEEVALLNLRARAALAAGDGVGAASLLEEVVRRDPMNGPALITLGDHYLASGRKAEAEFSYGNAARVEASRVRAWHALARMKVEQGDYRAALTFLEDAQKLEPRAFVADYIDRLRQVMRSRDG